MPFPEDFRLVTKPDGEVSLLKITADAAVRAARAAEQAAVRRGSARLMGHDIDDDPASTVLVGIAAGAEAIAHGSAFTAANIALRTTTGTIGTRHEVLRMTLVRDPEFLDCLSRRLARDLAIDALERGMSLVTAPKVRWRRGYAFPTGLSPRRLARIQEHDDAREYETWREVPQHDLHSTLVAIVSAETRPLIGAARMEVTVAEEEGP